MKSELLNAAQLEWVDEYNREQLKEQPVAKIGEMIESKYLKQSDVSEDTVVTVEKVGKANVAPKGEEAEFKWLIRFEEFPKPMVLNSTNIKRLAKACDSDDTEEWIGQKVVLFVDPDVEFAGNVVGGLRIRSHKQAAAKPAGNPSVPMSDMEDDIPFSPIRKLEASLL